MEARKTTSCPIDFKIHVLELTLRGDISRKFAPNLGLEREKREKPTALKFDVSFPKSPLSHTLPASGAFR